MVAGKIRLLVKGRLVKLSISKSERIKISKLKVNTNIERNIKNNFLLVYTKLKRYSSEVSLSQKKKISNYWSLR